ncbi:MAG: type II toxin-antitoxin system prevent-host-death family antitoxin [Ilumatobacteraceae bacterium]
MSTASVSELKAKLSAYLREVRRGGEVQVVDRGIPIARLVPLAPERDADDPTANQLRQRQIAAGVLRPGTGIDLSVVPLPTNIDLGGALTDDRTDRL